jgi:hypothetical protein
MEMLPEALAQDAEDSVGGRYVGKAQLEDRIDRRIILKMISRETDYKYRGR